MCTKNLIIKKWSANKLIMDWNEIENNEHTFNIDDLLNQFEKYFTSDAFVFISFGIFFQ